MISKTRTVPILAANGNGAPVDVSDMDRKCVYVAGAFSASIQFQVSADGTNWFAEGSPLTTFGDLEITKPARYLRAVTSSYVSGTPTARVIGVYAFEAGGVAP